MFSEEDISKVLEEDKITRPVAEKLLGLYVGEADWWTHIVSLHQRLVKRHGKDKAAELVREAIAFTILLPAYDRSTKIDPDNPQNLLFWGLKYQQFEQRNWFEELKKVIRRDQQITAWRREALKLGVIDAIEYQPWCRQAYKWLCAEAEDSGVELTSELKLKFRQLVMAYGGAVVSYIFEKHHNAVKKIVNWRSGYFFERLIFNTYNVDEVLKIKNNEIKKTNSKWIKEVH